MAVDAHVYYALIRHFQPRRIVEVGAGWSTLVAAEAGLRNKTRPELTATDPYPPPFLRGGSGLSNLIVRKVQKVELDLLTSLGPGRIFFIDLSHVLRSGGEVQYEYCEILPRLNDGVLVHVHDVSLPGHYPRVYFESGLHWNEQYMPQAFLALTPGSRRSGRRRTRRAGTRSSSRSSSRRSPTCAPSIRSRSRGASGCGRRSANRIRASRTLAWIRAGSAA